MKRKIRTRVRRRRELEVPLWLVDGFNGFLALMIYNFILYISKIFGAGGMLGKLEESSGYFYLNSTIQFGATKTMIILTIIIAFGFSFLLGMIIGKFVRKYRK